MSANTHNHTADLNENAKFEEVIREGTRIYGHLDRSRKTLLSFIVILIADGQYS